MLVMSPNGQQVFSHCLALSPMLDPDVHAFVFMLRLFCQETSHVELLHPFAFISSSLASLVAYGISTIPVVGFFFFCAISEGLDLITQ